MRLHIIFLIFALVFFNSCSFDELSISEVKRTIQTCLNESPKYGTITFRVGKRKFYLNNKKSRLQYKSHHELAKQGLITVDSITTSNKYKYTLCNVELTERGKRYILKNKNKRRLKIKESVFNVKVYNYELDDVKMVNKSLKSDDVEVIVVYKKNNQTPFYILDDNKIDYWIEKEKFNKDGLWLNCK